MTVQMDSAVEQQVWAVRRALPSDAEQIAAHACYREEDAARRAGYAEWVRPRIGSRRYIGFFAMHEGRVIGGAGVVLLDWGPTRANPAGQMGRVANVFTDAALRGRGIATDLVARAMAACVCWNTALATPLKPMPWQPQTGPSNTANRRAAAPKPCPTAPPFMSLW